MTVFPSVVILLISLAAMFELFWLTTCIEMPYAQKHDG